MKCLNCNIECGGKKFCDELCHHGYTQRAYRELFGRNKGMSNKCLVCGNDVEIIKDDGHGYGNWYRCQKCNFIEIWNI